MFQIGRPRPHDPVAGLTEPLNWNVAGQQPGPDHVIAFHNPFLVLADQQDIGALMAQYKKRGMAKLERKLLRMQSVSPSFS